MSLPPTLIAQSITAALFAPYGDLMSPQAVTQFACNQGRGTRFHDLAPQLDVSDADGRAGISIYHIVASTLPFSLQVMERHPLGCQAFFPLNAHADSRYLIVVAPAGAFDAQQMQAFIVPGALGVNYGKGVWHLPIVALDKATDFLAIDRIGAGQNCDEVTLDTPWQIVTEQAVTM